MQAILPNPSMSAADIANNPAQLMAILAWAGVKRHDRTMTRTTSA